MSKKLEYVYEKYIGGLDCEISYQNKRGIQCCDAMQIQILACLLRIVKDNVEGKIKYWAGLPSCGQAGLLYCGQESRKLPFQVRQQPNIYFLHKILTQLTKSTGLK